jgi:hypothetical protein
MRTRKSYATASIFAKAIIGSSQILKGKSDFGYFRTDYLEEYEAICETALAYESGP